MIPIRPAVQGTSWLSGEYRVIAIISSPDEWVENAFAAQLISGFEDGLGSWIGMGGYLESGQSIEFVKYLLASEPAGFEVRIDAAAPLEVVFHEFVRQTGIEKKAILWSAVDY